MLIQTESRFYTPEEYLELEEKAEDRSEYINGEIRLITAKTTNHNKIAGNFYKKFPSTVQGQPPSPKGRGYANGGIQNSRIRSFTHF